MQKYIKLRMYIIKSGLQQGEVATKIGISHGAMSARMLGKQPFDVWQAAALCKLLDIPQTEFYDVFVNGMTHGIEIDVPQLYAGKRA